MEKLLIIFKTDQVDTPLKNVIRIQEIISVLTS